MESKEIKLPKGALGKPLAMEYTFQTDWVIVKPPPKKLDACPRCSKKHPIEAKRFESPMTFYAPPPPEPEPVRKPGVKNWKKVKSKGREVWRPVRPKPEPRPYASSSYWAMCPVKKEPILLFDVAISKNNYDAFLKSDFIKTFKSREDKKFLGEVKKLAASAMSRVKITMQPTAAYVWKYDLDKKAKAKKRA